LICFEEIKNHPWFNGIDWELLAIKKVNPPFKPKVKKSNDVSNFDAIFTQEPPSESVDPTDLLSPSPNYYTDFTYQDSRNI
jgi:serum/glucocorticoid-regulated kinase 2